MVKGNLTEPVKKRVPLADQLIARAGVGVSADASAFRLPA
jgi:hypothetical protein